MTDNNRAGDTVKMNSSIKEISLKLKEITDPDDVFLRRECKEDGRKGVADLVNKWYRTYEKEQKLRQNFIDMSEFESKLRQQGFSMIVELMKLVEDHWLDQLLLVQ